MQARGLLDSEAEDALEALLEEQASLRRVATLVARDTDSAGLFESVCRELGRVLGVESSNILRFEGDGTQTIVGAWAEEGAPGSAPAPSSRLTATRSRAS